MIWFQGPGIEPLAVQMPHDKSVHNVFPKKVIGDAVNYVMVKS
jgi:hypothetical protein